LICQNQFKSAEKENFRKIIVVKK